MTSEPTAPPGPSTDAAGTQAPAAAPPTARDGHGGLVGVDVPAVSAWLEANVAGAVAPFSFDLIAGGHSNLTYRVVGADGHALVLRRPPLGQLLASAHDMGREHKVIAALADTPVPVAPARGFCADVDVCGAPFYVMDFVEGHVIRDRAAAEAMLVPPARATAGQDLVDTLAAIHAVDIEAVGLSDLGRHDGYIARQLKRWYGQWRQSQTRPLPTVDEVHDLLSSRIPEQGPACIVHGDYRLDNTMVDDSGHVVAVLDWEICTLGDPLADVGLLMVYWTGPGDEASAWTGTAPSAPGFPDRGDLLARYAAVSGRDISGIDFYVAFAFWKLVCILEGVYARYLAGALGGGRDPSEHDTFRQQVEQAAEQAAAHAARL
jgi:aminoglycoside phosphotransferase (APT) family kinase protein